MEKFYLIFYFYHCVFSYKYLLIRIAADPPVNQSTSLARIGKFDMEVIVASNDGVVSDLETGRGVETIRIIEIQHLNCRSVRKDTEK